MRRSVLLPFLLLVASLGAAGLLLSAPDPGPATAAAPMRTGSVLPAVTCDFTPLSFNLVGVGPLEAMRPFSVTAGDTFEQFIAPPITATAASTASVIVDNGFTG